MWWSPFGSSAAKPAPPIGDDKETSDAASIPPTTGLPKPDPPKMSREEQASAELADFLKEIEIESRKVPLYSTRPGGTRSTTISSAPPTAEDISPDSLFPTDMSCRSSLDYAMFCQSFGGQFVNIYRYGSFRSCSNHWNDFWLCMRTKQWDEKDRRKAISDHFKEKAVKWKMGPSSEDVWEVRTEPVRDAFQESLEDLEKQIAEWKKENPGAPDPWERNSGTLVKEISKAS